MFGLACSGNSGGVLCGFAGVGSVLFSAGGLRGLWSVWLEWRADGGLGGSNLLFGGFVSFGGSSFDAGTATRRPWRAAGNVVSHVVAASGRRGAEPARGHARGVGYFWFDYGVLFIHVGG